MPTNIMELVHTRKKDTLPEPIDAISIITNPWPKAELINHIDVTSDLSLSGASL